MYAQMKRLTLILALTTGLSARPIQPPAWDPQQGINTPEIQALYQCLIDVGVPPPIPLLGLLLPLPVAPGWWTQYSEAVAHCMACGGPGQPGQIPEPMTLALVGIGLLAAWRRRRC